MLFSPFSNQRLWVRNEVCFLKWVKRSHSNLLHKLFLIMWCLFFCCLALFLRRLWRLYVGFGGILVIKVEELRGYLIQFLLEASWVVVWDYVIWSFLNWLCWANYLGNFHNILMLFGFMHWRFDTVPVVLFCLLFLVIINHRFGAIFWLLLKTIWSSVLVMVPKHTLGIPNWSLCPLKLQQF